METACAPVSRPARAWAIVSMALSGFAALGYQIVWTQQCALWLGHETAAILAVVAAFFGGIGLGSLALARRIEDSTRPVRWYAACEAAIALWALALALAMAPVSRWLQELIGAQPSPAWNAAVVFAGTFALLLPATAAMGATLPAMEKMSGGLRAGGAPIAMLYASNTLGAVAGVLGTAFILIPRVGLTASAAICIGANVACAVLAWRVFGPMPDAASAGSPAPLSTGAPARVSLAPLAVTGFLGIGYEVLVVRVLSQLTENTVYTFSMLLAVYLVGTAAGAAAYARARPVASSERMRDWLLRAVSIACLLGVVALACAAQVQAFLQARLGPGMAAALASEALLAAAAFLMPAMAMGALFSHLATGARAGGTSFGRALGTNTLSAAFAPPVFAFALPALGATFTLLLVAAGYLLLASARAWRSPPHLATAMAAAVLALRAPQLGPVDVPPGGRLVSRAEGAGATVSVVADADGVTTLHINNRQQEGSTATWFADARQAVLPLRLHPSPRHALFLGIGTGVTARAAAEDPALRVDAVELLPEVAAATRYFAPGGMASHPRLHVILADARRFVRTAPQRYDVIVADNFHPARSGSGALYTVEHFAAVRDRLARDGVFCQWLPLHQLDLDTLRSIVHSFMQVYPNGWALLATNSIETPVIGLVARNDDGRFGPARRTTGPRPVDTALGLAGEYAVYGSFIAGPTALARFGAGAPLNTDDRPVVAYRAPRITYAPDSTPGARLLALVREVGISPDELPADSHAPSWNRRLAAYWSARNRYLEIGSAVRRTSDVTQMLAQVRDPLLEVLDISADFQPAYDPLLHMATELAHRDAGAARALLVRLARIQPQRLDTLAALRALDSPAL